MQRDATSIAGRSADAADVQRRMDAEARRTPSEDEQILSERKRRKKVANEARERTGQNANPLDLTVQDWADRSADLGDMFRLFPNDPSSFIDDYLNPAVAIGSLASGLGQYPLNVSQGNYGEAALNLAAPILAGTIERGAEIAAPIVGKYLTTQTPLANAYKLNPYAYTGSPNMVYRGVGREGMVDAVGTGYFRANPNVSVEYFPGTKLPMQKDFTGVTYWTPDVNVARTYADVIAEVPKSSAKFVNRYGPNKPWSQLTKDKIDVHQARFYKPHWLHGLVDLAEPMSTRSFLKRNDVIGDLIEAMDYRNVWRFNPYSYQPGEGVLLRGLGDEGVINALAKGKLTSPGYKELYATPYLDIAEEYARTGPKRGPIAEIPESAAKWENTYGTPETHPEYASVYRNNPQSTRSNQDWSKFTEDEIGLEKVRILDPHWFWRYKEIPQTKALRRKRKK